MGNPLKILFIIQSIIAYSFVWHKGGSISDFVLLTALLIGLWVYISRVMK